MIWKSIKPAGATPAPIRSGSVAVTACGVWLAMSVAAAWWVAATGTKVLSTVDLGGRAILGWRLDGWAVAIWILVAIVGVTVCRFSQRYLVGEPGAASLPVVVVILVVATTEMAVASTIVSFALGWTIASVAIAWLLLSGRQTPATASLARSLFRSFVIADGALWVVAVGITIAHAGSFGAKPNLPFAVAAGAGLLLSVTVAIRAGLMPGGTWLSQSVAAPTPVSAVLHAGVVNAGGLLLLREAGLWHETFVGPVALAVAAAVTVIVGSAAMAVAPDVKGALVRSTAMQMSFMVLCCALGWSLAAVVHLVTHGMYKARRFLSAGGAVDAAVADRAAPPGMAVSVSARVAASVIPLAVFAASFAIALPTSVRFSALLATAAAIVAIEAGLSAVAAGDRLNLVVAVVGTVSGYVAALAVLVHAVGPSAELHSGWMLPALVVVAIVGIAAGVVWLQRRPAVMRSGLGRRWLVLALSFSTERSVPTIASMSTQPTPVTVPATTALVVR